jgi:hypothetical protein
MQGAATFGGPDLVSDDTSDAFVVKLSGVDGSHRWSRAYASAGGDITPMDMVVTPECRVALVGWFGGEAIFGTHSIIAADISDGLLLVLEP